MKDLQTQTNFTQIAPLQSFGFFDVIMTVCFLIGIIRLSKFLFTVIGPFLRKRLNLQKRYGRGYALVTGGSQGIGFAIAKELAKQNINIILVSRNQLKLQKAKQELCKTNEKIQVIIKSIDFESLLPLEYENAFSDILAKDVSILVNNVGYYLPHYLGQNSFQQLRTQMKINCLPIAILSRLFIPQMIKRKQRSAIINLSSGAAISIFSGCSHYSATKVFDDYLSQVLAFEYGKKVDVLTVRPFMVTSPMTRNMDSFAHTSTEKCAAAVVNDLGQQAICYGPFSHRLQGALVELVGKNISTIMMSHMMKQVQSEYNKRA